MANDDAIKLPVGDGPLPGVSRYGEPVRNGASFRCGACGEIAGVVGLVRTGEPVDMGPPRSEQTCQRDGVIIDYWLHSTCWIAVGQGTWVRVSAVLEAAQPDPAALHAINWEFAPFFCQGCKVCYCRDDWNGVPLWDGPFYDYTDGQCPAGHWQIIDD